MRHLIFIFILLGMGPPSFGAETAFSDGLDHPEEEKPAIVEKQLDPRVLYGSANIPKIEQLDEFYDDDDYEINDNSQCLKSWQDIRAAAKKTKVESFSPDVVDLVEAQSKKMGFSMSKFKRTLAVYMTNRERLPHQNVIAFIDYDKSSRQDRMYIVSLKTGEVRSYRTAHGRGSDPKQTGEATVFANKNKTWTSSLGCFVAGGFYSGSNGKSLRLHGFEEKNYSSCSRDIVIHQASQMVNNPIWRSQGCPAVIPRKREEVFNALGGGTLVCSYRDKEYKEDAPVMKSKKKKKKRGKKYRRARRHRR